ncbi:hypothetical protein OG921_15865 [Aldersonia sp. NBC_00410]|uniref:DUF7280 family protein n=1 Tax=Aldersonia sp. NBC_00410 TaxID=2975954 RepID=UPI0022579AF8|nr:hypothetical protein [Aldersonia sp. NBC_00410]MCX5044645.1 hypothetical protein [Aldersonia sp. NBC_00410]
MFDTTHTATVCIPAGSFQVTSHQGPASAMLDGMLAAQGRAGPITWTQTEPTFARGTTFAGAAVTVHVA